MFNKCVNKYAISDLRLLSFEVLELSSTYLSCRWRIGFWAPLFAHNTTCVQKRKKIRRGLPCLVVISVTYFRSREMCIFIRVRGKVTVCVQEDKFKIYIWIFRSSSSSSSYACWRSSWHRFHMLLLSQSLMMMSAKALGFIGQHHPIQAEMIYRHVVSKLNRFSSALLLLVCRDFHFTISCEMFTRLESSSTVIAWCRYFWVRGVHKSVENPGWDKH